MLARAGDEDDEVAGDVDPVHEDDPVHLVDDVRHGPDLPERPRPAPEGPAAPGHVGLGALRHQPAQEGRELLRGAVVAVDGAGAAFDAPPPLRAGARLAVPLHAGPADGALLCLHGHLRNRAFPTRFIVVDLRKQWNLDTLFVQVGKLTGGNFTT